MTDISTVYVVLGVAAVLLVVSIYLLKSGITFFTIGTMLTPSLISFWVSNLYLDGTLVKTTSFIGSNDSVVTSNNIIRDSGASQIFQWIGIMLVAASMMQLYAFYKSNTPGLEEVE